MVDSIAKFHQKQHTTTKKVKIFSSPAILAAMNITDYLAVRGHQKKIREALGISKAQVHQWAKGIRAVPLVYMARIELATAGHVTRKEMCPDWQLHWPELAYPSSAQAIKGLSKRGAALLQPKKQRLCTTIEPAGGCDARTKLMRASI